MSIRFRQSITASGLSILCAVFTSAVYSQSYYEPQANRSHEADASGFRHDQVHYETDASFDTADRNVDYRRSEYHDERHYASPANYSKTHAAYNSHEPAPTYSQHDVHNRDTHGPYPVQQIEYRQPIDTLDADHRNPVHYASAHSFSAGHGYSEGHDHSDPLRDRRIYEYGSSHHEFREPHGAIQQASYGYDCTSQCESPGCSSGVYPQAHYSAGHYAPATCSSQPTCGSCQPNCGYGDSCGYGDCGASCVSYSSSCSDCNACEAFSTYDPCNQPWYLGLSGSWQVRESSFGVNAPGTFINFSDGFGLNASIGRHCGNYRIEVEGSLLQSEIDRLGIQTPIVANSPSAGTVSSRSIMLNAYYDFDCAWRCWRPYVGAGGGVYQLELNSVSPNFFAANSFAPINATSEYAFAFQYRVGAMRPLTDRTDLHFGYRYFLGDEVDLATSPIGSFQLEDTKAHNFELGLHIRF